MASDAPPPLHLSLESLLATATEAAVAAVSTLAASSSPSSPQGQPRSYDHQPSQTHLPSESHPLKQASDTVAYGTLPLLRSLVSFSFSVLTFMTMTLPTALYRLLSWSFTLHLTFTTLLIAIAILCFIAWAVIRYRILTKYSRLPKTALGKHGSSFDLHPDNPFKSPQEEKENMGYPDEFLSAFLSSIKIFGYLEQPVFHELARHLQTRRLPAGDTILQNPELERSFYIVVDGCVQVYEQTVKEEGHDSEDDNLDESDTWDDPEHGYQLLNEVKNGGTLSSLFTILSLFTENVKLRHEDEPLKEFKRSDSRLRSGDDVAATSPTLSPHSAAGSAKKRHSPAPSHGLRTKGGAKTTIHTPTSPLSNPDHMALFADEDRAASPMAESSPEGPGMTPRQSDFHGFEDSTQEDEDSNYDPRRPRPRQQSSSYEPPKMKRRVIVAKAMVDTTLAVIPAEAFHRLTQKFPQAAAHIVQVILIRFQRVTLLTGHKYLGLTKELLRMERSINEIGSYGLPPDFFRPRTMEYLKSKFSSVRDESDDDDHPILIRIRNNRKRASRLVRSSHPCMRFYSSSIACV